MCNDKLSTKEIYSSLTPLIIHSADNLWNRLGTFLIANSFLILAWVALFTSNNIGLVPLKAITLASICIIGVIGCIAWSLLGYRGTEFLRKRIDVAAYIEEKIACDNKCMPYTQTNSLRETLPYKTYGGRTVLIFGPLLLVIFYIVLFFCINASSGLILICCGIILVFTTSFVVDFINILIEKMKSKPGFTWLRKIDCHREINSIIMAIGLILIVFGILRSLLPE